MLIVDPPEGWKYGFPKLYTFKPSHLSLSEEEYDKERKQWFRDEGYPEKLIRQDMLKRCRYWNWDNLKEST